MIVHRSAARADLLRHARPWGAGGVATTGQHARPCSLVRCPARWRVPDGAHLPGQQPRQELRAQWHHRGHLHRVAFGRTGRAASGVQLRRPGLGWNDDHDLDAVRGPERTAPSSRSGPTTSRQGSRRAITRSGWRHLWKTCRPTSRQRFRLGQLFAKTSHRSDACRGWGSPRTRRRGHRSSRVQIAWSGKNTEPFSIKQSCRIVSAVWSIRSRGPPQFPATELPLVVGQTSQRGPPPSMGCRSS